MLTLNYIRQNKDNAIKRLAIKNFDAKEIIDLVITKDDIRKSTQNELDTILSESNRLAKEIGEFFKIFHHIVLHIQRKSAGKYQASSPTKIFQSDLLC